MSEINKFYRSNLLILTRKSCFHLIKTAYSFPRRDTTTLKKGFYTFGNMSMGTTIFALSTPIGQGAIGIVRISGEKTLEALASISMLKEPIKSRHAYFTNFLDLNGKVLDEVLLTYFKGPQSYTGEDMLEIAFHGSQYILSEALHTLSASGLVMAQPGEFTQRAYLNGKLDLSQAEAVADLIASASEAEHSLAMQQMKGSFSAEIKDLREQLIHFASLIELELDFSEEDVEFADRNALLKLVATIQQKVGELISSFRFGNVIKSGVPVVIVGKPNAGKSTLLNQLLKEERAIVTDIPGTTRDAIEDVITLQGIRFRFVDTAGIRETTDTVESIGVQRSLDKLKSARIGIYLFDINEDIQAHETLYKSLGALREDEGIDFIPVANKVDLASNQNIPNELAGATLISLSAKNGEGINLLEETLVKLIKNSANATDKGVVVSNIRHHTALNATQKALDAATSALNNGLPGDLVAADIREALYHLGSITGEISTDDLLGNIFGKFCIGK